MKTNLIGLQRFLSSRISNNTVILLYHMSPFCLIVGKANKQLEINN